jgi:hypothetical protein
MGKGQRIEVHTGGIQSDLVGAVIQDLKAAKEYDGPVATSIFFLSGMGVCVSFTAYYIIHKLIDQGTFWGFLPEAHHKLAVVSEYLGADYRIMRPDDVINRCLALMRRKGLSVSYAPLELSGPGFQQRNFVRQIFGGDPSSPHAMFCIIYRDKPGSGGSQIEGHAISTVNGHHRFLMDPNHGEYEFNTLRGARTKLNEMWVDYRQHGFDRAVLYECNKV